jgi:hypothetical protein
MTSQVIVSYHPRPSADDDSCFGSSTFSHDVDPPNKRMPGYKPGLLIDHPDAVGRSPDEAASIALLPSFRAASAVGWQVVGRQS